MSWTVVSPRGDPSLEGKNGSDVRTHTDTRTQHRANNPAPFLLRFKTLSSVSEDCASCNYTAIIFFFLSQFLLNILLDLFHNESNEVRQPIILAIISQNLHEIEKKIGPGEWGVFEVGGWVALVLVHQWIHTCISFTFS